MIRVVQKLWTDEHGWTTLSSLPEDLKPHIVFVFGDSPVITQQSIVEDVMHFWECPHVVFCSTSGEIVGVDVYDGSVVATAVFFEGTRVEVVRGEIEQSQHSFDAGLAASKKLPHEDLVHAMVFSEGLHVNGTELVRGLTDGLPDSVSVTGGLVGDGDRFLHTYVGYNAVPKERSIVLVGFYGENIRVGYGSFGGWDPFGPNRLITKSDGNVLFEIDQQSALELYQRYLGDRAKNLPSSGLLFPLLLTYIDDKGNTIEVVRTLLDVDEVKRSMTFAGDMPEGALVKLMKANFDRLIDGSSNAASLSVESFLESPAEFAILISCIGRKLVLKERVDEEVEAAHHALGDRAAIAGFYSYGEICPTAPTEKQCHVHNQTMTITTFREI